MISVADAEQIILSEKRDYGTEEVPLRMAFNRQLAEDLVADRDLPPYNRVTMDGVAINYRDWEAGTATFRILGIQPAGLAPQTWTDTTNGCIEIMTGAAMPEGFDTVVRYEDITMDNGRATIAPQRPITQGQNIHLQGTDKSAGATLVRAGKRMTPALAAIAASVGKSCLLVKNNPRVVMLTTGSELRDVLETPEPYEIRKSNNYMVAAALHPLGLAIDEEHVTDDPEQVLATLNRCLERYDAILISGGVSAGKYDFIPDALKELGVHCRFYKVAQRPGKPFWFGVHTNGTPVFAFPGNPVSAMMCIHRFFLPWLMHCMDMNDAPEYAVLDTDFKFQPSLTFFLPVRLTSHPNGRLMATPIAGNGSGDFAQMAAADAFMELPAHLADFKCGTTLRVWRL